MPSAQPASRGVSTIRLAVVIVVAVAAAGVSVGWFLGGDGGTDPESIERDGAGEGDIEPMALEADLVVVSDEVWVFGGLAGPEGSSPPMSSEIPRGWDHNQTIVMYGPEGDLRFHAELPALAGHETGGGVVIASGDDRHLLVTGCGWRSCDDDGVGKLYRLVDGEAILVREGVFAEVEAGRVNGRFGRLMLVGTADDGTAWVTVETGNSQTMGFYAVELYAIDLDSGHVTRVEVPDGATTVGHICVSGDEVFSVQEQRDDRGAMVELRVLRSPAGTEPEWSTFFEPDVVDEDIWAATLKCLPSGEVVAVLDELNRQGFQSIIAEPSSGAVRPLDRVPGIGAMVMPIGELDGRTIFQDRYGQGQRLLELTSDGAWTVLPSKVDWVAQPAVLGGQVRDISSARLAIAPDGLDFPAIDVSG